MEYGKRRGGVSAPKTWDLAVSIILYTDIAIFAIHGGSQSSGTIVAITKSLQRSSSFNALLLDTVATTVRVLCHERSRSKRLRATLREMEVGPSGSAIRSLIPSHRRLLWSKATVVSAAETPGR